MQQQHRIHRIRAAGAIKRFHTARVIKEESIAEHSLNVAALILVLTEGEASRNLLIRAMLHDHGEAAIGDIPANIKARIPPEARQELEDKEAAEVEIMFPGLSALHLSETEEKLLHIADRLDGLLKCTDEVLMGNRHLILIGERYCEYLSQLVSDTKPFYPVVWDIIHHFRESVYGR